MKDLSEYILSIMGGILPKTNVDVHLTNDVYYICVDVYEVNFNLNNHKWMKSSITEMIDVEINRYFPKGINHNKIINIYKEEYDQYRKDYIRIF